MLDVCDGFNSVLTQTLFESVESLVAETDTVFGKMKTCDIEGGIDIRLRFIGERFLEDREHGLEDPCTIFGLLFRHAMDTHVIAIQSVPIAPVLAKDAVESIHDVSIPVQSHVGNALGSTEVAIEFSIELNDNKVEAVLVHVDRTGVESVAQIVKLEIFRSERHA